MNPSNPSNPSNPEGHNEEDIMKKDIMNRDSNQSSNPSIRALAAPWSLLAFFAIVATAATVLVTSEHQRGDGLGQVMNLFNTSRSLNEEEYAYAIHEPLLPLTASDYRGFFCAVLGLMIAAGGGIGGGGILVPIYILVMGFTPKHAIPLSNITVFGGSLANTYLNTKKRHPLADRPLVDWDLILIMEPLTIAGALIGVFLNKLLREEILAIMLVLLLSFTAYNTLKKAMKMYRVESAHIRQQRSNYSEKESELTTMAAQEEEDEEAEAGTCLLGSSINGEEEIDEYAEMGDANVGPNDALAKIHEEEKTAPMGNITLLVVMFVVVLFINIMKGGGAFPSPIGIKCGSPSFWTANLIMLAWILMISYMARTYLLNRYKLKASCGYRYVEGDIQWTSRATIIYPVICALAGFFAGMFGVGGGIVKGPLMLAMGVHPKVSSASSACMILFTSFTATTSFVVFGLLIPDYALVCLVIGFVSTFVGQVVLNYLMSKYQRNSYIAFSIGGVVLLSAFLMTIQSLVSIAEGGQGRNSGVCGVDE